MAILFILFAFLAIVVVDILALIYVLMQRSVHKWLSISYLFVVLLALVATILTTGVYSYYSNPNTHVFGWPIPRVIFQRDTPTSPSLEYVGPTIVLAYPINFALYMFFLSAGAILLILRWRRHDQKQSPNNSLQATAAALASSD